MTDNSEDETSILKEIEEMLENQDDDDNEEQESSEPTTMREEMDGDVLTMERFPEYSAEVLGVLIYWENYDIRADELDTGEWDFVEEGMTRSEIVSKLPHYADLNVDQVKYRCAKMAEIDTPLVYISWMDHPQSQTPTAFYSPTGYGMTIGATHQLERNLFGELDTIEEFGREDLHELLHEYRMLQDRVEELEERLADSPY